MKNVTNKTNRTPLGFGALELTVEPGATVQVADADWSRVEGHPVVKAWIKSGDIAVSKVSEKLTAEQEAAEKAAREKAEAEELAALEAAEAAEAAAKEKAEAAGNANKTPTPTPTPKK